MHNKRKHKHSIIKPRNQESKKKKKIPHGSFISYNRLHTMAIAFPVHLECVRETKNQNRRKRIAIN